MEIQDLKNAIISINLEYCTKEEFTNGDVFENNGFYYSCENYVTLHNGDTCHIEDAMYCEYYEEYYSSEDVHEVKLYNTNAYYSLNAIENGDFYMYEGDYYDDDALNYYDLCYVQDWERVIPSDEAYYNDNDGNWYGEPQENESYTRGYHNGSYKSVIFDNVSEYKIGYEIEKEDKDILESIYIDDFENKTGDVWRKETDGSLDSDKGFELISPTFEFNIDKIFELIESNNTLLDHINAKFGNSCGGHINLSKNGLSGNEFFDLVKGYTPLFYSLYYGRVDKTYSKGKSNADLKNENKKYQAIKIHDNRIEFRIISAVANVTTLKWRSGLLELICQNPTDSVIQAYFNIDTIFKPLLSEMYPTVEKMETLKNRIKKNTLKFENIKL